MPTLPRFHRPPQGYPSHDEEDARQEAELRRLKRIAAQSRPLPAESVLPAGADERAIRLKALRETGSPFLDDDMVEAAVFAKEQLVRQADGSRDKASKKEAMKFVGDAYRRAKPAGSDLLDTDFDGYVGAVKQAFRARREGGRPEQVAAVTKNGAYHAERLKRRERPEGEGVAPAEPATDA